MFDKLIVSILRHDAKKPLFSVEERRAMLAEVIHEIGRASCRERV